MRASLVIPTMNKLPRLKLVLTSIEAQVEAKDLFEVIIVDDGSTDGTGDYVKSLNMDLDIRLIRQKNSGRAATRNTGMTAANNELIIFADDDLILAPNFIKAHIEAQQNKVAIYHGRIMNLPYLKFFKDPSKGIFYDFLKRDSSNQSDIKEKCIQESDILENFKEKIACTKSMTSMEKMITTVLKNKYSVISWIGFTGGNVSVPKEWLMEEKGFDTQFGLNWGCEDLELGYRFFLKNKPIEYCDNAANYHIAHYRPDFNLEHRISSSYFYEKHKDENILKFQNYVEGIISSEEFLAYVT